MSRLPFPSDFFYLKGIISAVLSRLGIDNAKSSPTKKDVFSEGVSLGLGKMRLVEFGVVKRTILKELKEASGGKEKVKGNENGS